MAEGDKAGAVPVYTGRARIYADYESVGEGNVVEVVTEALAAHWINKAQELYLWDYYRGRQPVLDRVKDVRPEICNRIVENHASEIVNFKLGYQLAEPLQYTLRNHDGTAGPEGTDETEDGYSEHLGDLNELNTLMFARDKASSDRDLFEYMCVCGVGYRMVESTADDEEPFELHVLKPWDTFVVYSSAYHHRPIAAVWVGTAQDGSEKTLYNVYTADSWYLIQGADIIDSRPHTYGAIPIVEYDLNSVRLGAFEVVLPILDALNALESNRMDDIEQTVQSLMKFVDCDVDEDTFLSMLEIGAVKVKTVEGGRGDVDFIRNSLDQSQTQVTKEDLLQAVTNICGMPNRNGTKASTSDTGAAVLLRDGWTMAESHAKSYELQFKRAERVLLKIVLGICEQSGGVDIDLRSRDIELTFNRRNYENVLVKAQVLTTMLSNNCIHPEIAFKSCGMFTDPEAAYLQSKRWSEERAAEAQRQLAAQAGANHDPSSSTGEDGPGSQAGVPEPKKGDDASAHAAANA